MEKIRQLSLRRSIVLYMTVSLILSFVLSGVIITQAKRVQRQIWSRYINLERYFQAQNEEDADYVVSVARPAASLMEADDLRMSELCDFLQTYSVLACSVLGSCAAVLLFYRNKLKEPFRQLDLASRAIADNDLEFQVTYENQDEPGRLCSQFERMRRQLMENNRRLWKNIEDERALRAAIAHDIRSPLSVLKGYQEMLLEYVPDGTLDTGQIIEMLSEGMRQIDRMDCFVETMRRMNSLEDRVLKTVPVTVRELAQEIQTETDMLVKNSEVVIQVHAQDSFRKNAEDAPDESKSSVFYGDREMILETVENIVSNAVRYAQAQIEIEITMSGEELKICVLDDGEGFSEAADIGKQPFYRQNAKDSLLHTGLGMYISRLYCEKHGGALLIENPGQKGAAVTAIFKKIREDF